MNMLHIDKSISVIRHYKKLNNWGCNKLANEAGLRESTIRDVDDPEWNPTAATIRKLEGIIPKNIGASDA